jgi:hypothetical protein
MNHLTAPTIAVPHARIAGRPTSARSGVSEPAVLGVARERWLRWLVAVRVWPRCGPAARPRLTTGPSARNLLAVSRQLTLRIRDVLRVLDGEQPVRQ